MRDPARPRDFPALPSSIEVAAELLDVTNEAELDAFLGRLVAETSQRAGGRLPAGARRALVATLKRTAERTLPTLTVVLGDATEPAGPSAAETAARVYGVEAEGMSAEDRDYEIAHRFIRFAQTATARAAAARAPDAAAAVATAARELAPGLLPPGRVAAPPPPSTRAASTPAHDQ
jgi:hypothetical protein